MFSFKNGLTRLAFYPAQSKFFLETKERPVDKNSLELNGDIPLRRQIAQILSREFAPMPPGTRIPGGLELQKRFGVSYHTVTAALDELIVRGEIIRINGKGSFTASREVRTIYYLIPCPGSMRNGENEILKGVFAEAKQLGSRIITVYMSCTNQINNVDWANVRRIPPCAPVIVSGFWYWRIFDFLVSRQCNVVYLNDRPDLKSVAKSEIIMNWHRIDSLRSVCVAEAVKHLKEAGRRKILLLHTGVHCQTTPVSGFRTALKKFRLRHYPELEFFCHENYHDQREMLEIFISEEHEFDAVIAQTSQQALAASAALQNCGRRVPKDVSLVSLTENLLLSGGPTTITSIAYDQNEVGMEAVKLLAGNPKCPEVRTVRVKVIDRNSI